MNLTQIKTAVNSGITVNWSNSSYVVIRHFPRYPDTPEYLIKCLSNNHCIGLTWRDGKTLNGKEKDFYTIHHSLSDIPDSHYLERGLPIPFK